MNNRHRLGRWAISGLVLASLACGVSERTAPERSGAGGLAAPTPQMMPVYQEVPLVLANEDETVLTLAAGADPEAIAAQFGLEIIDVLETTSGLLVRYDNPLDVDLQLLRQHPEVTAADPNIEVTMGEVQTLVLGFLEGTWDPEMVAEQTWIAELGLPELHQQVSGAGARIAILDTGAYTAHPLLVGKTMGLPDDAGLGTEEFLDHIDNDEDGEFDEAFGHGTHVAGCVATVAPGATILPIKVITDDGVGCLWDILRGLELARDEGANVISLSLSLSEPNESMEASLLQCKLSGIAVLSAAGNYGNRNPRYPGTSEHAVGVASVGEGNVLSPFSGAGAKIELAAPGELVLSAYPRAELWHGSGTSMATPIAAGCVALVMDGLNQTALEAVQTLCTTSVPITPRVGVLHGRVSPASAL